MEASRVVISPATMVEAQKPLSPEQKRRIRYEKILELVRSTPYGERLRAVDFTKAVGDSTVTSSAIGHFVEGMVKTYLWIIASILSDGWIVYLFGFLATVAATESIVYAVRKL